MAGLGLNVFQVLQNGLISREGNRSTLGLGYRLHVIEERIKNAESISRNGRVWKPHHSIHPVAAPTLASRRWNEKEKKRLLQRRDAKGDKDVKDPSKYVREETWEVHEWYPRTVLEFKDLRLCPEHVRSLVEFYEVKVHRPDLRLVSLDSSTDVFANLESCLEELAIAWGLDWYKIGGLSMPGQ